jgi:hypothetical protein
MRRLAVLAGSAVFVLMGCGGGGGGGPVTAPDAPSFLQAVPVSSSAIRLSWMDDAANETGFKVYRGTDPGNVTTMIGTLPANATIYLDTGRAASTTYHYAVVAFNAAGDSAATNVTGTTTDGAGGSGGGSAVGYYTTGFDAAENPISEGGAWLNGRVNGFDWSDVKTSDGNATGTQNRLPDGVNLYDDSVAVLSGTWGPDQTVEAVVHAANRTGSGASGWDGNAYNDCGHEVELILRGTISAHSMYLYEVNFSSRIDGSGYTEIGKWTGPRGNFAYGYLSQLAGARYQVNDGDVVRASIVGNTISVYLNNEQIVSATDTVDPIARGNPGIGFYTNSGCTGTAHNDDFGFKSMVAVASDGG